MVWGQELVQVRRLIGLVGVEEEEENKGGGIEQEEVSRIFRRCCFFNFIVLIFLYSTETKNGSSLTYLLTYLPTEREKCGFFCCKKPPLESLRNLSLFSFFEVIKGGRGSGFFFPFHFPSQSPLRGQIRALACWTSARGSSRR